MDYTIYDYTLYVYYTSILLIISGALVCWTAWLRDTSLSGKTGNWAAGGLITAVIGICGWIATVLYIFKDLK